ncbi:MAG TPA: hypothetical protein VKY53_05510 [Marinobacter sp.]|nr:hypothetical protein [Marinobacter sp.]
MKQSRRVAWYLTGGLVVWAVWFVVLYGGLSLTCELFPPEPGAGPRNWFNYLAAAGSVLLGACLFYLARRSARAQAQSSGENQSFVRGVSVLVFRMSGVAAIALALPVLVLPPCL